MEQADGGCTCRFVRYRMSGLPMIVHCCRWCQRESGAAFAQRISRCPRCRIALWSNYAAAGSAIHFVRVGTLAEPDRLSPDVHIFTASKQPWVVLAPDVPAVPEYYKASAIWSAASLERRERVRARREQTQ